TITSGSIGVSGPRGAGKTMLLRYFSDPSFSSETGEPGAVFTPFDLRFIVSAPVTYQQRDFILHVFGKLCADVIRFENFIQPCGNDRHRQRTLRTGLAVLPRPKPKQGSGADLLQKARHWQESIRYAPSFTAGSSGSLGLPRAIQVGVSNSHQVTEIPLT